MNGEIHTIQNDQRVTPMTLIDKAISQGINPDQLGKLMDLQERWEKSRASEAYNRAMVAAQAEMPTVIKERANAATHKNYAPLEDVQFAIKPVYVAHGFSLNFGTEQSHLANHYRVTCEVLHVEGERRQFSVDIPIDDAGPRGEKNKSATQGAVSAMSYGRRTLVCMIFNVNVADQDKDGTSLIYVGAEQIKYLKDLLVETGGDEARFLKWCDVDCFDNILAIDFRKRADALISKKKGVKK